MRRTCLARVFATTTRAAIVVLGLLVKAHAQPLHPQFISETLYTGNAMITIEFGPTGQMYVIEKRGRVLVFVPNNSGGFTTPQVFVDISARVNNVDESGLLGMALAPDFATSRNLYLFYTTTTDQRLVRIHADATLLRAEANSETVLLSGLPRAATIHKGGHIAFNPADPGYLYIGIGDDGVPSAAQTLTRYEGKILRVLATSGTGPSDNPFYDGNPQSVASRIFARGLRNPFRFTFHSALASANVLYLSENGDARDRVAWVTRGSNGNWSGAGDSGFLNPPDPNFRILTNDSRDTNGTSLIGICIARGGAFADPANPSDDVMFVANGAGLPGAFASGIRRWRLTGTARDTATLVAADNAMHFARFSGFVNGAHMTFGPDGALYLSQAGGADGTMKITRVRRVGGTPPVAAFAQSPIATRGAAPMRVQFNNQSSDADGTVQSSAWDFGDGETSTVQSPDHVFSRPGRYSVTLRVTDNSGQQNSLSRVFEVFEVAMVNLDVTLLDARTNVAGAAFAPATELRFYSADGTTPAPILGATSNVVAVPAGGRLTATRTFELVGDGLVISAGEPTSDGVHPNYVGFRVAAGPNALTFRMALSNQMIRGRVRDVAMLPLQVDIGIARGTAGDAYSVALGRDYTQASRIPTTGQTARVVSDALGYYAFAIRTVDTPAMFFVDAVADTGADDFLPTGFNENLAAAALIVRDLRVGRQTGGAGCESLADVAATPNVDYRTQIEPIWGACIGCHSATASNNADLNLVDDSFNALRNGQSHLVPGASLVHVGNPATSFLMEKLNCDNPQVGARMPPLIGLSTAQQALVRDWIQQGAGLTPSFDASIVDGGRLDAGIRDAVAGDAYSGDANGHAGDIGIDATADANTQELVGSWSCNARARHTNHGAWTLLLWPTLAVISATTRRQKKSKRVGAIADAA